MLPVTDGLEVLRRVRRDGNPVPVILVNYDSDYTLREGGRLADIAPTLIDMMGMEKPAEMTGKSLLIPVSAPEE